MFTIKDILLSIWLTGGIVFISLIVFFIFFIIARIIFGLPIYQDYEYIDLGWLWVGLPFSIVGIIIGFITGLSREPAISALIPAVLTLIGGIVLYLINKDRNQAVIAGFSVIVLSFNLFVGSTLGSINRGYVNEQMESLEYLKKQADKEFLLQQYRKGYGLPPYPPSTSGSKTKQ
jgi:hypothetical protein